MKFIWLMIAAVIGLGANAQRTIDLQVNKHNFANRDTIRAVVEFKGFDDDPITDEVFADVYYPRVDSVVLSAKMIRVGDNRYYAEMPLPSNGFDTPEDISKISRELTAILNRSREDRKVLDKDFSFSREDMNKLTYLGISQVHSLRHGGYTIGLAKEFRNKDVYLVYSTDKGYYDMGDGKPMVNMFNLQITGITAGGEVVATIEPITLHVIVLAPYHADKKLINPEENFLQYVPYEIKAKEAFF